MGVLCLAGVALGLGYNALGRAPGADWGIAWIGKDRLAELAAHGAVAAPRPAADADPYVTPNSDPLAIPADEPGVALPEVPAIGRPVQIEAQAVRQLVDAEAAFVIDARESAEYAAGHIPGAINLPYDEVAADTARLEKLDTRGRPIVVYCGGGTCEQSLSLAYDLVAAGHTRVAVYVGGFPEWHEAGHPVTEGPTP
jgi:rhodanese-related sulfurtransferase